MRTCAILQIAALLSTSTSCKTNTEIKRLEFKGASITGTVQQAWLLADLTPQGRGSSYTPEDARNAGYSVGWADKIDEHLLGQKEGTSILNDYRWLIVKIVLTTSTSSLVVPFDSICLSLEKPYRCSVGLAIVNTAAIRFAQFITSSFPSQQMYEAKEHEKGKYQSNLLFELISLSGNALLGSEAMRFADARKYELNLLFAVPSGDYTIEGIRVKREQSFLEALRAER